MDGRRFDAIARQLAQTTGRRALLRGLGGGILGGLLAGRRFEASGAAKAEKVVLCHKGRTIAVAQAAVKAHLGHGDALGACPPAGCPSPEDAVCACADCPLAGRCVFANCALAGPGYVFDPATCACGCPAGRPPCPGEVGGQECCPAGTACVPTEHGPICCVSNKTCFDAERRAPVCCPNATDACTRSGRCCAGQPCGDGCCLAGSGTTCAANSTFYPCCASGKACGAKCCINPNAHCGGEGGCCESEKICFASVGEGATCCPNRTDTCFDDLTGDPRCCPGPAESCCPSGKTCPRYINPGGHPGPPMCCPNATDVCVRVEGESWVVCCPPSKTCRQTPDGPLACCAGTCVDGLCT